MHTYIHTHTYVRCIHTHIVHTCIHIYILTHTVTQVPTAIVLGVHLQSAFQDLRMLLVPAFLILLHTGMVMYIFTHVYMCVSMCVDLRILLVPTFLILLHTGMVMYACVYACIHVCVCV
jgi:hypothetical protein